MPRGETAAIADYFDDACEKLGAEPPAPMVIKKVCESVKPGSVWVEISPNDPADMSDVEKRTLGAVGIALLRDGAKFPGPDNMPNDKVLVCVDVATLGELREIL